MTATQPRPLGALYSLANGLLLKLPEDFFNLRTSLGYSLRDVATEMRADFRTLNRFENQETVPGLGITLLVLEWMAKHADDNPLEG